MATRASWSPTTDTIWALHNARNSPIRKTSPKVALGAAATAGSWLSRESPDSWLVIGASPGVQAASSSDVPPATLCDHSPTSCVKATDIQNQFVSACRDSGAAYAPVAGPARPARPACPAQGLAA